MSPPLCRIWHSPLLSRLAERASSILQYRPPIGAICVELPAGLIDEGESPETSALRELHEETGYGGDAFDGRIEVVELGGTVAGDPGPFLD